MSSRWLRGTRGGSSARLLALFLAAVLLVAIVGPGIATYGAEGESTAPVEESAAPAAPEPVVSDAAQAPEAPVVPQAESTAPSVEAQGTAPASIAPLVALNPALTAGGIRIDAPPVGVTIYNASNVEDAKAPLPDGYWIKVTVWNDPTDGQMFSFESNFAVSRIIAKGGTEGYLAWNFDPAVKSATGLHCPVNPSGFFADISHLDVYFDDQPSLVVYKYQDDDQDQAFDEGSESMLADWEFKLYNADTDALLQTGTTDSNGKLDFGTLEPGNYYVTETLQSGWNNTTALTQYKTLAAFDAGELWFGNVPQEQEPEPGDLVVYKFQDDDQDQAFDEGSESMLSGWEFKLYRGDYFDEIADELVDTKTTDGNGQISWTGLDPGQYYVIETLTSGWVNTTLLVQHVTVVSNEERELWFGNVPEGEEPKLGNVIIHKFSDDDEDQVWDEGREQLLKNWEFTIGGVPPLQDGETGAWLEKKYTNNDGEIVYEDLPAGTVITATETLPAGWENTTPLTQQVTVPADGTAELWFGNIEFLRFTELDLAITKTVDDRTVDEGQLLTYTLTYWNTMDEEAAVDYNIIDDYDERYLQIVDSAGGTVADGKIRWDFAGPLSKADGKKTITYTARVIADMPDRKTNIDNVVRIWDDKDTNPSNNQDDERVVYDPEPYLPFTGGEYLLLIALAVFTGVVGLTLRLKPRKAS